MTIMSRAHGGGWPKIPFGLDAWILALPYLFFWPVLGWWVIPAYLGAVLGLRLGHGRGFHYDRPFKEGSKPEKVEWVIPKSLPVWARKVLIMALTGLAVTMIAGLVLLSMGYAWAGLILLLSGLAKSLAYLLPETEWAEYARGFFLGLGVVIALVV